MSTAEPLPPVGNRVEACPASPCRGECSGSWVGGGEHAEGRHQEPRLGHITLQVPGDVVWFRACGCDVCYREGFQSVQVQTLLSLEILQLTPSMCCTWISSVHAHLYQIPGWAVCRQMLVECYNHYEKTYKSRNFCCH